MQITPTCPSPENSNGKGVNELLQLRDDFLNCAALIASKYGKLSTISVVNLLMNHACEKHIVAVLENGCDNAIEFDRIWRNMHDYASLLLVEKLKNEFLAKGISVNVESEAKDIVGVYDVSIINGENIQLYNSHGKLCIELKVGLNISLNQLEKYLWNTPTLILARFATGDVVKLRAQEIASFLQAALKERIEKATRILNGVTIVVPGRDCLNCNIGECKFRKESTSYDIFRPRNLGKLLEIFLKNLSKTIDIAVMAVLEEVNAWKLKHACSLKQ